MALAGCAAAERPVVRTLPPRGDPYAVWVQAPSRRAARTIPVAVLRAEPAFDVRAAIERLVPGWSDADRGLRLPRGSGRTEGFAYLGDGRELGTLTVRPVEGPPGRAQTELGLEANVTLDAAGRPWARHLVELEGPEDVVEATERFLAEQAACSSRAVTVELRHVERASEEAPAFDALVPLSNGLAWALVDRSSAAALLAGAAGFETPLSSPFEVGRRHEARGTIVLPQERLAWARVPDEELDLLSGWRSAIRVAWADGGRTLVVDLAYEERPPADDGPPAPTATWLDPSTGLAAPEPWPRLPAVRRLRTDGRWAIGADEALVVLQAALAPGRLRLTVITWR